jgi:hypothetical protein
MTIYHYLNNSYNDDDDDNDDDNDDNDKNTPDESIMTSTVWDNLPSELKNSIAHQVYHGALSNKHPYAHLSLPIKNSSSRILCSLRNCYESLSIASDNEDLELSFNLLKQGLKHYTNLVTQIEDQIKVIQLENEKSLNGGGNSCSKES